LTDRSNGLTPLIHEIESQIDAGTDGLPEELFLFVSRITPLINVDLLIRDDDGRTLLTWRRDRFYGSGWHVPGGIIRYKETAADRIRIVARHELGATVEFNACPIFIHESIDSNRRDRGHFISLLYKCRVSDLDQQRRYLRKAPSPGQWQRHEHCPENLIHEQRPYAVFVG
jgi:ADP-ribose pyrophosphatase YjhB (NUDIX family)